MHKKVDALKSILEKELEEKIEMEIQYKTMLLKHDIKNDLSNKIDSLYNIVDLDASDRFETKKEIHELQKAVRKLTSESIGHYSDVF